MNKIIIVTLAIGYILQILLPHYAYSHGTMTEPVPRQPEPLFWYQVGCMIGCTCSGGGKETYPTKESVNCNTPDTPTLTDPKFLTWNIDNKSVKGDWNKYMPWKKPGSAKPIDSCGIASGFDPKATTQYPHTFKAKGVTQGMKGTDLPKGKLTYWKPGAKVTVKFRLIVNHGGGYQYRVCPTKNNNVINEACFEQNPLKFATQKHVVEMNDKQIPIAAIDVSNGVVPVGSTWRKLPLPACNCDLGSSCTLYNATAVGKVSNNDTRSYASSTPYGACKTGLQFDAPHLHDGSWPDGYGYYVEKLGFSETSASKKSSDTGKSGAGSKSSTCYEGFKTETACNSENECIWKNDKGGYCYEKDTSSNTKKQTGNVDSCNAYKDKSTCDGKSECLWYASKSQCYKPNAASSKDGFGGNKAKDNELQNWNIADEVFAPAEDGEYILQWRWDNEQTPQIWTTCADIVVCDGCEPKEKSETSDEMSISSINAFGGVLLCNFMILCMNFFLV